MGLIEALLNTHQGDVPREQLDYYLDECAFGFNRRTLRPRGVLESSHIDLDQLTHTFRFSYFFTMPRCPAAKNSASAAAFP